MRKRKYLVGLIALISVLALGIVFAATAGFLSFNGTAVISPNAKVVISDAQIEDGTAEDTYSISPDGQTLDFTVALEGEGDFVTINYSIANKGNVPVTVSPLQMMSMLPPGIDIVVTQQEAGELSVGSGFGGQIIVTQTDATLPEGGHAFTAGIDYQQM